MPTPASHVWRPSSARLVAIDGFVPAPRGGGATAPAALSWPVKDPADVLDYLFDISDALTGDDGDAIGTLDASISPANPGDLQLAAATADGALAVLWLGQGISGTTYTITLSIGTVAGRNIQRSVMLPVLSLSNVPPPGTGLLTNSGAVVTDQTGNPLIVE